MQDSAVQMVASNCLDWRIYWKDHIKGNACIEQCKAEEGCNACGWVGAAGRSSVFCLAVLIVESAGR